MGRPAPGIAGVDRRVDARSDRRRRRRSQLRLPVVDQAPGALPRPRLQRAVHRRRSRGRHRDDDDHPLRAVAAAAGDLPLLLRATPGSRSRSDEAGEAGAARGNRGGRRRRRGQHHDRGQARGRQRWRRDPGLRDAQRQRPRRPGVPPHRRGTPLGARRRLDAQGADSAAPECRRRHRQRLPLRVRVDERRHRGAGSAAARARPPRTGRQPGRLDRVHGPGVPGSRGRRGNDLDRTTRRHAG